jgi:hypothetical protein
MTDLINSENGSSGDVAVIGETSQSVVSLQTLQGIYNELTGKSEAVSKSYNKPIQIDFANIEQLDRKITQVCEQYNIVSSNCSATIFYVDDTREQFSSFDRFRLHNTGSASPVESVLLKYNFLVLLPKTKKPQPYTVSIRLASRVAIVKKMLSDFYGPPPQIFRLMGNRIAVVEIEYIDYLVARNFLNLIDEWFKVLPTAKESKIFRFLQSNSHQIPKIARFCTAMIVGFIILKLLPKYVSSELVDLLSFGSFLGYSLLVVYAATTLAGWAAQFIESSVDSYTELSYLKLTNGDEIEIVDATSNNRDSIIKAVLAFLFTIFISVLTNIISNYLTPLT